jgi:hypothetical protein
MKIKLLIVLIISIFIISCGSKVEQSKYELYTKIAKYIIVDNGPYNAWNGGPRWIYYCDSYEYKDNHYILKNNNGDIVADFTKEENHRIEIRNKD